MERETSEGREGERKEEEEGKKKEKIDLESKEEKGRKKAGRPTKEESMGRERANSLPLINSFIKGTKERNDRRRGK